MMDRLRTRVADAPRRAGPLLLAVLIGACAGDAQSSAPVVLAATHTLQDSGLLDTLTATFHATHPDYQLRVIVSGTGEALEQAKRGDVDVVLSHAPDAERAALEAGDVQSRHELMYNEFLIVGPEADPAGVAGMSDAAAALVRIAEAEQRFVSRDDRSGTNLRELALWRDAGRAPPDNASYIRSGVGMADALRVADERAAYILTDPATYAVLQPSLALVPLVTGDPRLRNTYSVMRVARARHPDAGRVLEEWLKGAQARRVIESFGVQEYGRALFTLIE